MVFSNILGLPSQFGEAPSTSFLAGGTDSSSNCLRIPRGLDPGTSEQILNSLCLCGTSMSCFRMHKSHVHPDVVDLATQVTDLTKNVSQVPLRHSQTFDRKVGLKS